MVGSCANKRRTLLGSWKRNRPFCLEGTRTDSRESLSAGEEGRTQGRPSTEKTRDNMQERLQKIIARAGIASRRHAEQLILSGQVRVNGHVVRELGTKADAAKDRIEAAGKKIAAEERKVY